MSDTAGLVRESVFLLTPLREGRPDTVYIIGHNVNISTHAPAGGATRTSRKTRGRRAHFYSRPCGRGDMVPPQLMRVPALFLLTPLREGRPYLLSENTKFFLFLLTPLREGRLDQAMRGAMRYAISTHAPAGGATMISSSFLPRR